MGFGNVPGQGSSLSAIQIRDALQSLTGANRLDASAIKNIGAVTPPSADPLFTDVVLLLPLTTTSGLADTKGNLVTNSGSTMSTAVLDPFGSNTGVRAFPGAGARISVAQSADFAFGAGAFAIEGWLYPTTIPGGLTWGIMDTRPSAQLSDWVVAGESSGKIGFADFSYPSPYYEFGSLGLSLNQWQYFCLSRTAVSTDKHKLWINGVLATTATTRNNAITAASSLLIGDQIDTGSSYGGSFTGYMSNIRITRAYRDGSIVPTAPFPTS
jgi:hypothetical protein